MWGSSWQSRIRDVTHHPGLNAGELKQVTRFVVFTSLPRPAGPKEKRWRPPLLPTILRLTAYFVCDPRPGPPTQCRNRFF